MKKLAATLSIPLFLAACAQFQNPDSGEPVADRPTQRSVSDVVNCLTEQAQKHNAPFKTTSIPQGEMLDFGDSNIVRCAPTMAQRNTASTRASVTWTTCGSKAPASPARPERPDIARPRLVSGAARRARGGVGGYV